ncbi:Uncharacterised protein [Orientia tsutsugamushi]|nr:PRANC domain protein [Orientia tsutsugamushi str. TA763]SPP24196.1 Uncharacterised protein [Orientia tsutsugamushi]
MKRTKASIGTSVLDVFVKNTCINTLARLANNPNIQIYPSKLYIYIRIIFKHVLKRARKS